MKIKTAIGTLAAIFVTGAAHAAIIDFEDAGLPGQSTGTASYDGVAWGFNSNGYHFSNADVVDLSGTVPWWAAGVFGAHSGNYSSLNDWSGAITMTKIGGGTFSFEDFWLAGWQGVPGSLDILGYLNGSIVTNEYVIHDGTWAYISLGSGFGQVDKVVFSPLNNGYFFLDDIAVDGDNSVPEPITLALVGTGLFGMAALRRQKKYTI